MALSGHWPEPRACIRRSIEQHRIGVHALGCAASKIATGAGHARSQPPSLSLRCTSDAYVVWMIDVFLQACGTGYERFGAPRVFIRVGRQGIPENHHGLALCTGGDKIAAARDDLIHVGHSFNADVLRERFATSGDPYHSPLMRSNIALWGARCIPARHPYCKRLGPWVVVWYCDGLTQHRTPFGSAGFAFRAFSAWPRQWNAVERLIHRTDAD